MFKELIENLGGAKQVAADLKVSHGAVRNWMMPRRAIPWRFRPTVAKLAAERGLDLPNGFWAVAARPKAAAEAKAA